MFTLNPPFDHMNSPNIDFSLAVCCLFKDITDPINHQFRCKEGVCQNSTLMEVNISMFVVPY